LNEESFKLGNTFGVKAESPLKQDKKVLKKWITDNGMNKPENFHPPF
jgi:hypothetical protein